MPVKVSLTDHGTTFVHPTETWKTARLSLKSPDSFHVDENFYVNSQNMDKPTEKPASVASR